MNKLYNHTIKTISGNNINLEKYHNKILLIVNTASKCGFTPQYEGLQKLYDDYNSKGLEILGFPCNQFFQQEPGNNQEIAEFCQINYGVNFPIFAKIDVNGDNTHPLFKYLKENTNVGYHDPNNETAVKMQNFLEEKVPNNLIGKNIRWNFTKFLIDRNGNNINRFESYVTPDDLVSEINKLL